MKTTLLRLGATAALLCGLSYHAFCDAPLSGSHLQASKPTLTLQATSLDVDNYVQYFRQQGYLETDRHQEFNSDGTLVAFHYHATRPEGKPTPTSQSSSVDTWATSKKVSEKLDFGPTVQKRRHKAHQRAL